ncbi:MAG: type IV pilus secretin PilQ, partial [Amphritea sp.]|nr:type IV pilus secretin PilQ [Amphritea sp.]
DDETNVLMVRETANRMEEIRSTLRRFDTEVAQVLIEARLVTANTTVSKDLGVKWGLGYGDTDSSGNGISIGSTISDVSSPGSISSGLMVDLGANTTTAASVAVGLATNSSLLQLELSALESDGRIEVISQPKVVTTNGKVALIESGSEVPYVTTDDDGNTDTEFKDVVLSLEVTPRINPGDRIAMDLVIKKDSIGETLSNGEISIIKNLLETSVVVADGQTVVLGGVFENETQNTVNKTPLLGDIPVLGALFRNKSTSNAKAELLIFITPKLIKESLSSQ